MSTKSEEDYAAVFKYIKEKFPMFSPQVAMSDYEKGLRNAIKKVFTTESNSIRIGGCFFHYCQVSILIYSILL